MCLFYRKRRAVCMQVEERSREAGQESVGGVRESGALMGRSWGRKR